MAGRIRPRRIVVPEVTAAATETSAPAASFVPKARRLRRLLVVSNRLPDLRSPALPDERKRPVGGLVSALQPVLAARDGLWFGWSGRSGPTRLFGMDDASHPALAWIDLPSELVRDYYNGFCNRALWPLLHSFPSRMHFRDDEWTAYVAANEAFADAVSQIVADDAPVWVHDFHLLLAGAALRRRGHRGRIGLFLHVPFPSPDLLATLPWHARVVSDMLRFDLVGFQTPGDLDHFRRAARAVAGCHQRGDVLIGDGVRARTGAFPIGIIPEDIREDASAQTNEEIGALLRTTASTQLVVGVDRLDYTKGIPERLCAVERLLDRSPEWRGKVSVVQVSVPSRAEVPEYAEERRRVEHVVGRINGEFGEAHWTPVRYLYRSYRRSHLAQLYRAADVGLVTPLRDGMNLVAKEFVAAQDPRCPGVLLLSRFAGAAVELRDALLTNPFHVDGLAADLDRALRMDEDERRARHARLLEAVERTNAATWADSFLRALEG